MKASKATPSKTSSKVTSTNDNANAVLVGELVAVLNLEAEATWFDKATTMLAEGRISVRGLKATIEEAEKVGNAPTIKASHAQYLGSARSVRALKGGEGQSLKTVLNTTIQAKRAFGKDFASKVEASATFADFASIVPSQAKQKATREAHHNEKAPIADANSLIKQLGNALKAKPSINLKDAEALAVLLAQAITTERAKASIAKVA